jgi:molybdopterin-synthase adenylyltransferase
MDRLDRNVRFFGKDGQAQLQGAHVAVVGVGGLGSHVVQQLAYLGVGAVTLIDDERLDITNKNRYVSAYHDDPVPDSRKIDLGVRMIKRIDPSLSVTAVFATLRSRASFDAIKRATSVFGCVDNDGARLVLTELCAAYALPYFDLATEIRAGRKAIYGGRVCVALGGNGCPVCLELLDLAEAQTDLESDAARRDRVQLYGLQTGESGEAGPSVVSINGVIASLAVTEFMAWATGLREPNRLLTYRGDVGRVTASLDEPKACYYCKDIAGLRDAADVERFVVA